MQRFDHANTIGVMNAQFGSLHPNGYDRGLFYYAGYGHKPGTQYSAMHCLATGTVMTGD